MKVHNELLGLILVEVGLEVEVVELVEAVVVVSVEVADHHFRS